MTSECNSSNKILNSIIKYEGVTFEEATQMLEDRKELPLQAFCGPNRTYPTHNKHQVKRAIYLLNTLKPDGWEQILECVKMRAQRFGVSTEFQESKKVIWYIKKVKDSNSEEEDRGENDERDE